MGGKEGRVEVEKELGRDDGTKKVSRAEGGYLNEFDTVAGELRQGLVQSPLVPFGATVEVAKIMDECRRQLGVVYLFEKESGTPCN